MLYAGEDDHCAFIETFGRDLGLRRRRGGSGPKRAVRIEINGRLRLVDLTGQGLARLVADGRLTTVGYRVAQRWSLALHRASRSTGRDHVAIRFDPSRTSLPQIEPGRRSAPYLWAGWTIGQFRHSPTFSLTTDSASCDHRMRSIKEHA